MEEQESQRTAGSSPPKPSPKAADPPHEDITLLLRTQPLPIRPGFLPTVVLGMMFSTYDLGSAFKQQHRILPINCLAIKKKDGLLYFELPMMYVHITTHFIPIKKQLCNIILIYTQWNYRTIKEVPHFLSSRKLGFERWQMINFSVSTSKAAPV